jgi:ferredoxin
VSNIPKITELVIKNNLCTGCGLCVYKCPSRSLKMAWDGCGFYSFGCFDALSNKRVTLKMNSVGDSKIRWQLTALKIATIMYHYRRGISKRIRNLVP